MVSQAILPPFLSKAEACSQMSHVEARAGGDSSQGKF